MKSNGPLALGVNSFLMLAASGFAAEKNMAEAELFMHVTNAFVTPVASTKLPRVLIIGDSISIGYTDPVRKALRDKAEVCRPPENCQHTGHGLARMKAWLGTNKWDVIHFNFGIWDTHMLDPAGKLVRENNVPTRDDLRIRYSPDQYRTNLTRIVEMLQATGASLVWASTTPIMSRTGKRFEDIKTLNRVAGEIMRSRNIPVNDLYEFVLPNAKDWQNADQVHFNKAGNEKLAGRVSGAILDAMKNKAK